MRFALGFGFLTMTGLAILLLLLRARSALTDARIKELEEHFVDLDDATFRE